MEENKNKTTYFVLAGIIAVVVLILVMNMGNTDTSSPALENSTNNVENINNTNQVNNMEKNIVQTAIEAGSFNTLVTAVQAAGLVETLSGTGPFTVFAPTDEAFAKIPKETLDAVLADKDKLTQILTYHVVSGKVMASDVINLTSAKTVQGGDLKIDTSNGVKVNDANVVQTDIETSNGVIHVIDTVLMPN